MKKVKCYLVFTSFVYRLVIYLAVPAGLIGFGILTRGAMDGLIIQVIAWLYAVIEILADNWLFGGIQSKDSEKLDYLKTSAEGMRLMKNALWVDMARKFLWGAVILTGCYFAVVPPQYREALGGMPMCVYLLMLAYTVTVAGNLLSRYGGMVWVNLVVGYVAGILMIVCCFLPGLPEHASIYAVVFGALGIFVSIMAVRTAMGKVEGSYYDE